MKVMPLAQWAVAMGLCGASALSLAQSQTVYRCGAIYSDRPCPQSVTISSSDARSGAQKAQTDEATARITKLADQLEKSRKTDEAAAQRNAQLQAQAQAIKAKVKASATDQHGKPHKRHSEPEVLKPIATLPLKHPKKASAPDSKADSPVTSTQRLQPSP